MLPPGSRLPSLTLPEFLPLCEPRVRPHLQVLCEAQEAIRTQLARMLVRCSGAPSPTPPVSLFPFPPSSLLKSAAASVGMNTWAGDKCIYFHFELWVASALSNLATLQLE